MKERPWWAQRYTLHDLILALIALLWSFIALIVVIFDKDADQVWVILTAIITYYFTRRDDGRTRETGTSQKRFPSTPKPRTKTKGKEGASKKKAHKSRIKEKEKRK